MEEPATAAAHTTRTTNMYTSRPKTATQRPLQPPINTTSFYAGSTWATSFYTRSARDFSTRDNIIGESSQEFDQISSCCVNNNNKVILIWDEGVEMPSGTQDGCDCPCNNNGYILAAEGGEEEDEAIECGKAIQRGRLLKEPSGLDEDDDDDHEDDDCTKKERCMDIFQQQQQQQQQQSPQTRPPTSLYSSGMMIPKRQMLRKESNFRWPSCRPTTTTPSRSVRSTSPFLTSRKRLY